MRRPRIFSKPTAPTKILFLRVSLRERRITYQFKRKEKSSVRRKGSSIENLFYVLCEVFLQFDHPLLLFILSIISLLLIFFSLPYCLTLCPSLNPRTLLTPIYVLNFVQPTWLSEGMATIAAARDKRNVYAAIFILKFTSTFLKKKNQLAWWYNFNRNHSKIMISHPLATPLLFSFFSCSSFEEGAGWGGLNWFWILSASYTYSSK